jgi:mono/diheme cytochrome c family protein
VPTGKIAHRHKAWFIVIGALALVLLGAGVGTVILLSGAYSTAATKQHFLITYRILELGLKYSVAQNAAGIVVPDLDRVADVKVGHACYREHCLQCHGGPGVAREPLGRGQLPSPSSLSESAREWAPAHLFYVMQQGVRMSGMPAWEFRISEQGLWSTVAFLKAMPRMTAGEYKQFAASSVDAECPKPTTAGEYSTERAQMMLRQYACDNCHQIEGMVGPVTHIGPSLRHWRERKYIAGILPNTRENLVRWIVDPQGVSPHTLMPDLDVIEAHAEHMARYLMTAEGGASLPRLSMGKTERGRAVLERYECGVCHVIPGIRNAVGRVGPSLDDYAQRPYVAGKFPNETETLARWIRDAPAMAPQTAMPAIAMSQQEARDAAAYLYKSD